jgi:hypothetical protein
VPTPAAAALLFGKQQIQLTVSYLLGSTDTGNDTRGTFQFKGCSVEELNQGFRKFRGCQLGDSLKSLKVKRVIQICPE